jgi:hypothetical protein
MTGNSGQTPRRPRELRSGPSINGGLDRSTGSGRGGSGHQAPRGQAETRQTGPLRVPAIERQPSVSRTHRPRYVTIRRNVAAAAFRRNAPDRRLFATREADWDAADVAQILQFCACFRMCPGIRLSALSSCVGCDTALALEARSRPARPGFLARCYRLRPLPHRPGLEEGMRHGNGNCGWSMSGPRRRDHPAHLFTGGYVRQVLGWVVQQGLAWVTRGTGWQRALDHVRWP